MTRQSILNQIQDVFCSVFEQAELTINENTTANDIEKWDSLTHIVLVVEIEKIFDLKFLSSEMTSWKSVGEMIDSIESKID